MYLCVKDRNYLPSCRRHVSFRAVCCFVDSLFAFQGFVSFYFLWICTKTGLMPEHKHKDQVSLPFFLILILLSSLLLIVCVYAISCCLPCILIKVLFILRLSRVQCHSLVQTKPQSDFVWQYSFLKEIRYNFWTYFLTQQLQHIQYLKKKISLTEYCMVKHVWHRDHVLPAWEPTSGSTTFHTRLQLTPTPLAHIQGSHAQVTGLTAPRVQTLLSKIIPQCSLSNV